MVKVEIMFKDGTHSYDLDPSLSLENNLTLMRTVFKCPPDTDDIKYDYVLQHPTISCMFVNAFLNKEELLNIAPGTALKFRLRPSFEAERSIAGLKDTSVASKKKAVFNLKTELLDDDFTAEFLSQGGLSLLALVVRESTASTLAYALNAYQIASRVHDKWEDISDDFIRKVLSLINSTNLSVSRAALELAVDVVGFGSEVEMKPESTGAADTTQHAAAQGNVVSVRVHRALPQNLKARYEKVRRIVEEKEGTYQTFINLLTSSDLTIQTKSLEFLNVLVDHCPAEEKAELLKIYDSFSINKVLNGQVSIEHADFQRQVLRFCVQRIDVLQLRKEIPYDKENPEHEKLLMEFWHTCLPDKELDSRVSKMWGLLGFQGKDPASDFRGMGLMGLEHIIYFARHYPDVIRKIVATQAAKTDGTDYPCAIVFINISNMLFSILCPSAADLKKMMRDPHESVLRLRILFDHPTAFEEMYCICCQVLDRMWRSMNASYMDFGNVMKHVTHQMSDVLASKPATLVNFEKMAFMLAHSIDTSSAAVVPDDDSEEVQALKTEIEAAIVAEVKAQRVAALTADTSFLVPRQKDLFRLARLSSDRTEIRYSKPTPPDGNMALSESVLLSDLVDVKTGYDSPMYVKDPRKSRKFDEEEIERTLTLVLNPSSINSIALAGDPYLHLVCRSPFDLVHWADGLRVLLGKEMACEDTLTHIQDLVTLDVRLKRLNDVWPEPPPLPPPLPEEYFDTCLVREEENEP
eukprot:GCRY01003656.1.p1 GENE.GCRY01003656.1~~GCRY01003656.1.p1  ORF type:complete len:749 (+),score=227.62 GCRY01003656.1:207-2453(+)